MHFRGSLPSALVISIVALASACDVAPAHPDGGRPSDADLADAAAGADAGRAPDSGAPSDAGRRPDAAETPDAAGDAGSGRDASRDAGSGCPGTLCGAECVDLDSDEAHCGACDAPCTAPSNGSVACLGGECAIACDAGYHACGAECAPDDSTSSCGTSCAPCVAPPHATATCDGTSCGFECEADAVLAGGACLLVPAPRPIAPASTSRVTTRRPRLEWELAPGTDGARVELCADRACASVIATLEVTGTVAAPSADLPAGVVYFRLFGRAGAITGAATSPTWSFTVPARSAPRDAAWGTTFDVNGDGYADLVAGSSSYDSFRGRVHVFFGGAAGIATSPSVTLEGSVPGGGFGTFVSGAGDVDGDGFADLLVGASYEDTSAGRVYLFLGGPAGPSATPISSLSAPDPAPYAGFAEVRSAGDVDRDGYGDVLVAACGVNSSAGRAYLFYGGPSGLAPTPDVTLVGPDTPTTYFCEAVPIGDVNADGFADIAVGTFRYNNSTGRVYVHHGSAAGLVEAPAVILDGRDGIGANFGHAVDGAGDVNGDGYADLVVGAYGVYTYSGRVYVYLGGAAGTFSAAPTMLSGLAASGLRSYFGTPVAGVGDVDLDGYDDIAVSATAHAGDNTGYVYFYRGSASGVATSPSPTRVGPDGSGGHFGDTVGSAGDVDGDGDADVYVGGRGYASETGRVYLYAVGPSGLAATPVTIDGPDGAGARFGLRVAGAE